MKKLVALVALPTKLVTGEGEIRAKFKYPFTFWADSRGGAELGVAKRNETEVRLRQVLVRGKKTFRLTGEILVFLRMIPKRNS